MTNSQKLFLLQIIDEDMTEEVCASFSVDELKDSIEELVDWTEDGDCWTSEEFEKEDYNGDVYYKIITVNLI